MRWLLRFGYDGADFHGWARQPGKRTVEGVLRAAVAARGIAPDPEAARIEVASRTDRGVSARANALTLVSPLGGAAVLRRLNSIAPDLFFTAAAPVPVEFRVRSARERIYRYFDPRPTPDLARLRRAAGQFVGRIDVRSFGREVPSSAPRWRDVTAVAILPRPGGRTIEVRAPSFVWGMVRKIVGTLREVEAGHLALDRLEAAVAGSVRLTVPLAEPEGLVLWEVAFDRPWEVLAPGPNRHQAARAAGQRAAAWQRREVLEALDGPA